MCGITHDLNVLLWHFIENGDLFCPFSNWMMLRTYNYTHSCLIFQIEMHFHVKKYDFKHHEQTVRN